MFYLKLTDFEGVFQLPVNTTLFQTKLEKMIEQREFENIKYVLGVELGQAFYADLDNAGEPQEQRFIDINDQLKYSVLRYTFQEVFTYLRTLNSPLGAVNPNVTEASQYPSIALATFIDEAATNGNLLRKNINKNCSLYPEWCAACVYPLKLRKSIL
jgi:hypothetical protein